MKKCINVSEGQVASIFLTEEFYSGEGNNPGPQYVCATI
jgi:hypothetical protein